ncbi:MAG: DUF2147 domain-containing protein [Cyclobacteriaceae bacterium]
MKAYLSVLFIGLFVSFSSFGQSITGKWKTIDDETGKPRSIVDVYEKDGKVFGKIIELFRSPDEDPDPDCEECTDHRKGKKVIGMEIISDMKAKGDEYVDGEILDPEDGKIYRCKLWVEEGTLKVRGYVSFLYRTQTWLPVGE